MSLDVYLYDKPIKKECYHCSSIYDFRDELYWANITHNLGQMASEVLTSEYNLYAYLWKPETIGIKYAKDLIEPLTKGLVELRSNPAYYKQFNAKNGWGTYDNFVDWLQRYLNACIEYPEAEIEVSR